MIEIKQPQIITEESADGRCGRFIVEPLEKGLGTTLGNSLRRMLLSALPGTAIVGIKIDGVQHEFSTIPAVAEDVVEIILNLKGLNFRAIDPIDNDNKPVIRISREEPGVVTGADINCGGYVEVLNPEHYICTLDEGGRLDIELTIGSGRGYVSADKNKDDSQPIGYIPIDSIFTPVVRASYSVEATRVGQNIDYDKLILEVETNGTISCKDIVSLSAKILDDHARLFVDLSAAMGEIGSTIKPTEENKQQKVLDMAIEELDLSVRSYNCLKRASIHTVDDLTKKSVDDMLKVRNLGQKSLEEVIKKLADLGLQLRSNDD